MPPARPPARSVRQSRKNGTRQQPGQRLGADGFEACGQGRQASNRPTYQKCLQAISVFRQHGHNNGRQNTAAGKTFLKTFKNRDSKALTNGRR